MRPLFPFLALLALLPAAAFAQSAAECEYRNPDYPDWNFVRNCTVTTETAAGRTTIVARMTNGSDITLVEEGTPQAQRFTINGYPSRPYEEAGPGCFLTTEDRETICIRMDGAEIATGATEPAPEAATPTGASGSDAGFGGGVPGHCLAWVSAPARAGLIERGACTRRTDCAEIEGGGGMSCLIDFVWDSGRETVITSRDDVYTLDGAVAQPAEAGCFTDRGAGLDFCFSEARMTEAKYPALALAPAAEPAPVVAARAASETAMAVTADPGTAQAAAVAPGNRCSFLRDEVEVSSWRCTETITCEAPLCTVTYVFENGTAVTLDTAEGQVMLMNGAKADPAAWAEGTVVDVTRPGAPYTFRFSPGAGAVAR